MKLSVLTLALLVGPATAFADGFDYTFVEAGIVNTEIDVGPFDVDGDGFGVTGSYALTESLHLIGGYSDQDYDFGLDGHVFNVGGGFNTPLNPDLDFVAQLSYYDVEAASAFGNADDDGLGIGAGIRARPGTSVELDAGITYVDLDDSDTVLNVGVRYYFSDTFAIAGGLADDDSGLSWSIGVRAEFGR
jgi:opacity protein-like surface antigen